MCIGSARRRRRRWALGALTLPLEAQHRLRRDWRLYSGCASARQYNLDDLPLQCFGIGMFTMVESRMAVFGYERHLRHHAGHAAEQSQPLPPSKVSSVWRERDVSKVWVVRDTPHPCGWILFDCVFVYNGSATLPVPSCLPPGCPTQAKRVPVPSLREKGATSEESDHQHSIGTPSVAAENLDCIPVSGFRIRLLLLACGSYGRG